MGIISHLKSDSIINNLGKSILVSDYLLIPMDNITLFLLNKNSSMSHIHFGIPMTF